MRVAIRTILPALLLGVLTTIAVAQAFALRRSIVLAFVPEGEVAAVATSAMVVLMVAQPFMAVSIVFAQALRGAGRTREALVATSLSALFVRLGATYVF